MFHLVRRFEGTIESVHEEDHAEPGDCARDDAKDQDDDLLRLDRLARQIGLTDDRDLRGGRFLADRGFAFLFADIVEERPLGFDFQIEHVGPGLDQLELLLHPVLHRKSVQRGIVIRPVPGFQARVGPDLLHLVVEIQGEFLQQHTGLDQRRVLVPVAFLQGIDDALLVGDAILQEKRFPVGSEGVFRFLEVLLHVGRIFLKPLRCRGRGVGLAFGDGIDVLIHQGTGKFLRNGRHGVIHADVDQTGAATELNVGVVLNLIRNFTRRERIGPRGETGREAGVLIDLGIERQADEELGRLQILLDRTDDVLPPQILGILGSVGVEDALFRLLHLHNGRRAEIRRGRQDVDNGGEEEDEEGDGKEPHPAIEHLEHVRHAEGGGSSMGTRVRTGGVRDETFHEGILKEALTDVDRITGDDGKGLHRDIPGELLGVELINHVLAIDRAAEGDMGGIGDAGVATRQGERPEEVKAAFGRNFHLAGSLNLSQHRDPLLGELHDHQRHVRIDDVILVQPGADFRGDFVHRATLELDRTDKRKVDRARLGNAGLDCEIIFLKDDDTDVIVAVQNGIAPGGNATLGGITRRRGRCRSGRRAGGSSPGRGGGGRLGLESSDTQRGAQDEKVKHHPKVLFHRTESRADRAQPRAEKGMKIKGCKRQ